MVVTILLALISPAVALALALWGYRRANRADQLRAFFEMHERYLDERVRAGRRLLHQRVAGRSVEQTASLDAEERRTIGFTLATMNALAIACEGGYVRRDLLERSMGRSYVSAVHAAKPYIDHLERVRGFRPYGYAERLAARTAARLGLPDAAWVGPNDGADGAAATDAVSSGSRAASHE